MKGRWRIRDWCRQERCHESAVGKAGGGRAVGRAGIIGLSKAAALDYADQGIQINVIAPGPILTDHLRAAGERAQRLPAESVPLGRMGATSDVGLVC
jgi:NAD(P)-dependent dehydrogenase (short-subunit alcohol dehydrogenase family)